jgi:phage terminase large subunit-like protein
MSGMPPLWCTAVPDWESRLLAGQSLLPELPLNRDMADKAERIFKRLRIPDIAGQPAFGEAGGQWFIDIVRALFGAWDPATDIRHIQELFMLLPKKNSKTTNSAGLMVTAMIMNAIPNVEMVIIAPTKEIAGLSFAQAKGMIRADAELAKKFHVSEHQRKITHLQSRATLQIKAADTDAITGSKAYITLIDEVHVFASHSRAADVFLELRGALAARSGGLLVMISTQSKRPPAGVFKAELKRARAVRDGKLSAPLLAVIYELPKSMQEPARNGEKPAWRNPDTFRLVNPNLGRSVRLDFLVQRLSEVAVEGDEALQLFASQHLNVEIGVGIKVDGWAGAKYWGRGADPALTTLDALLDRSEVVTLGIDGGGLDDLFGLAVLGREKHTRHWLAWCHALISPEGMKQRRENAPLYADFIDDGNLTLVERLPLDLDYLRDLGEKLLASGLLAGAGADAAGIGGAVDALDAAGISEDNDLLGAVPQGIRLMGAAKTLERKLVDGTFRHSGSRLMDWCVGNLKIRQTSTAVLIERAASGLGKIDPFMALLNAAHLMALNPKSGRSVYEDRGFLVM